MFPFESAKADMRAAFKEEFGVPCRLLRNSLVVADFTGQYYSPGMGQPITLSPMGALAVSMNRPTVWADLADVNPQQEDTLVVDPDLVAGVTGAPLQFLVHDTKEDGIGGIMIILKSV